MNVDHMFWASAERFPARDLVRERLSPYITVVDFEFHRISEIDSNVILYQITYVYVNSNMMQMYQTNKKTFIRLAKQIMRMYKHYTAKDLLKMRNLRENV